MNRIKNTFIDLFAGIGGTRIGFEEAGCKCVFSSEYDRFCQDTYELFFREIPHGDITLNTTKMMIPKGFNILVAGFPCQPFSGIGKRQGFNHVTQGTLFHEIIDVLRTHRPEAILLENVSGLLSHDNKKTFDIIKSSLDNISEDTKYWIDYKVINAADYGVPQIRKRLYIVGFRKDLVNETDTSAAFKKLGFSFENIKKTKKVKYINPHLQKNVLDRSITKHLQKAYLFKKNDGKPQLLEHHKKQIANTLVATYYKIQRLTGIYVKDGPTGLRLLTENECRAIMGFPKISKKYPKIRVSRTQMYKQFGNSVAVPIIKKIAIEINNILTNRKHNSY